MEAPKATAKMIRVELTLFIREGSMSITVASVNMSVPPMSLRTRPCFSSILLDLRVMTATKKTASSSSR